MTVTKMVSDLAGLFSSARLTSICKQVICIDPSWSASPIIKANLAKFPFAHNFFKPVLEVL